MFSEGPLLKRPCKALSVHRTKAAVMCATVIATGIVCFGRTSLAGDDDRFFFSTCSRKTDVRGPSQKVIAYSLYGDVTSDANRIYVVRLRETMETIRRLYPGWTVRIYSDNVTAVRHVVGELDHVDLCDIGRVLSIHGGGLAGSLVPMTWRFLPLLDPSVDYFMSRDADSLVLQREVDAVDEWLADPTAVYHLMRDHLGHLFDTILGGLWGVKVHQNRLSIAGAIANALVDGARLRPSQKDYGGDQRLLHRHLWPLMTHNVTMAHESFGCGKFSDVSSSWRPFPSKRVGTAFVGQPVDSIANHTATPCPIECRPKANPEWIYC